MIRFWLARVGWAFAALALLARQPILVAIGLAMIYTHLANPVVLEADPTPTPEETPHA